MNNAQIGKAFSCAVIFAAGLGLGSLLTPTPSKALEDASQLLSGGMTGVAANQTASARPERQPPLLVRAAAKAKVPFKLRMPAGTLRRLRVKLTTQTVPSAGILTIVVRRNGNNTTLTCELSKAGECGSNEVVAFAENDKLSVRMINNFTGSGVMGLTYVLLFN